MKVKEWKSLFENLDNDEEIIPYIWDYSDNDENPYDVGKGTVLKLERGYFNIYLNIGIHK